MLTKWFLRSYFRCPKDWPVSLGRSLQPGVPFAVVHPAAVWKKEPLRKKIGALLHRRWEPGQEQLWENAAEILMTHIFGTAEDYGDRLLELAGWFYKKDWQLDRLTREDRKKVNSIDIFTGFTRSRYIERHYSLLSLRLVKREPRVAELIFPMVLKAPVISLRYFVDIHYGHTFNAIRKADHPQADGLIVILYELAFIQQKIAQAFHKYIWLLVQGRMDNEKKLLNVPTGDALHEIDTVIANLKVSIEKIAVFAGLIFDLPHIGDEQSLVMEVALLQRSLPAGVLAGFQWRAIADLIGPESLEELYSYRSVWVNRNGMEVFAPLREKFAQNSLALLCALSLLDERLTLPDPVTAGDQLEVLNLYKMLR
jgi:hypothetical protein